MSYSQRGHRSLGQATAQPDMTFELDSSGRAAHEAGYTGPASKTPSGGGSTGGGASTGGKAGGSSRPAQPFTGQTFPAQQPAAYVPANTDYMPWVVGGAATLLGVGLLGWLATR